ncbi:hypothetical protein IFR05_003887 [Cadophora sp. M221]|nr:hypothetical protein IFR05_003887 [Cadophora sp. M221]
MSDTFLVLLSSVIFEDLIVPTARTGPCLAASRPSSASEALDQYRILIMVEMATMALITQPSSHETWHKLPQVTLTVIINLTQGQALPCHPMPVILSSIRAL